jgi:hypothetical protein
VWTKTGYSPDRPAAPKEQGERLATFPRGEGVEMRVCLAEYQGRPFVSFRVWERNQAGEWWPVKGKGGSIRMGEAAELARVLAAVAGTPPDPANGGSGRREVRKAARPAGRTSGAPKGPQRDGPAPGWSFPGPRPETMSSEPFDEFGPSGAM